MKRRVAEIFIQVTVKPLHRTEGCLVEIACYQMSLQFYKKLNYNLLGVFPVYKYRFFPGSYTIIIYVKFRWLARGTINIPAINSSLSLKYQNL